MEGALLCPTQKRQNLTLWHRALCHTLPASDAAIGILFFYVYSAWFTRIILYMIAVFRNFGGFPTVKVDRAGTIIDAAEVMLAALDAELETLRQRGVDDLLAGRLGEVRALLDRIERLQSFRDRAARDWDELFALFPPTESDPSGSAEENLDRNEVSHRQDRTGQAALNHQRERIIDALSAQFNASLKRHSQAMFRDDLSGARAICTVSKDYGKGRPFWYAFHPYWGEFLEVSPKGVFALGMMGREVFVCLPHTVIREHLDTLHRTERPDGTSYWHLHVTEPEPGRFRLGLPKTGCQLDLAPYLVKLS